MSLGWNELGRVLSFALGGASIFGAVSLASIVTQKKIGANLLIPTKHVHNVENLRCWMAELERLVVPVHDIVYLQILGTMDDLLSKKHLVQSKPKELDKFFGCMSVSTYETLVDLCSRLVSDVEKQSGPCPDVRELLTNIKRTFHACVTNILLACKRYPQVDFKLSAPFE